MFKPSKMSLFTGTHPSFPSFSSALKCTRTDTLNRCMTAQIDIPRGSILMIEQPYGLMLRNELVDFVCNFCGKRFDRKDGRNGNFVACGEKKCGAKWCGQFCRKSSRLNHTFECGSKFDRNQLDDNRILALRTIFRTPVEQLIKYDPANRDFMSKIVGIFGSGEKDKFKSDSFVSVASLVDHIGPGPESSETSRCPFDDYIFAHHSVKRFLTQKQWPQSVDLQQRADILRRHLNSILAKCECNMYAILPFWRVDTDEAFTRTVHAILPDPVAIGLFPCAGLLNHSCNPNLLLNFDGFQMVASAIRDIKCGQVVFANYGPILGGKRNLEERRNFLQQQFHFWCICDVCEGQLTETDQKIHGYKCDKCQSGCVKLQNPSSTCTNCDKEPNFTLNDAKLDLMNFDNSFQALSTRAEQQTVSDVLKLLKELEILKGKYFHDISIEITSRMLQCADCLLSVNPAIAAAVFGKLLNTYRTNFGCHNEKYLELLAQTVMAHATAGTQITGKMKSLLSECHECLLVAYGNLAGDYMAMKFGRVGVDVFGVMSAMNYS